MSTFVEVVMAFEFDRNTPAIVLAAFRPWLVKSQFLPSDPPDLGVAESLFEKNQLAFMRELDHALGQLEVDAFLNSLDHEGRARAFRLLFRPVGTAYFPGEPSIALTYRADAWTLTIRTYLQEQLADAAVIVAWLGKYVRHTESRHLVGYLKHEYLQFPNLIWTHDAGFEIERLDEAAAGDW